MDKSTSADWKVGAVLSNFVRFSHFIYFFEYQNIIVVNTRLFLWYDDMIQSSRVRTKFSISAEVPLYLRCDDVSCIIWYCTPRSWSWNNTESFRAPEPKTFFIKRKYKIHRHSTACVFFSRNYGRRAFFKKLRPDGTRFFVFLVDVVYWYLGTRYCCMCAAWPSSWPRLTASYD